MSITLPARERDRAQADEAGRAQVDAASDSIEWLIDNADAYARLLRAVRGACRSVRIAQLALSADCIAYEHGSDSTGSLPEQCTRGEILADTLLAVAAHRDVQVSVLLNATLLLDTSKRLRRHFASGGARGIQVRGAGRFPWLLHAKLVIVDGTDAFLIGSPFANGYWDDPDHRPVDSRRPLRELAGRPLHDVSVRVTGPVVADLDALFCDLWNNAPVIAGDRAATLVPCGATAPTPARRAGLRIARTLSPGAVPGLPDGATEILDACLDGIARARSLIYIEHQYLSARPVVAALAAALRREPALEIIAVLNQNPDITAYRGWQTARLTESGLLEHPRVGLFSLWSTEPDAETGRLAINQVFVHSKVLAVDDRWATIGSANLDGASLHSYGDDFDGRLGRWLFRGVRNVDVNIVVDDPGADGAREGGTIADLRRRLWSEHLGMSGDEVAADSSTRWLALWRRRASENVGALNGEPNRGGQPRRMRGFVLPYSPRETPARQLADIGVYASAAELDLRFDPGWLEVHVSPNWVRNMFA